MLFDRINRIYWIDYFLVFRENLLGILSMPKDKEGAYVDLLVMPFSRRNG
jgi:hypothetical protein